MNTATEIDKINDLISQSRAEDQPKLYPLGERETTVEIQALGITLRHKLRKPTLGELKARDAETPFQTEEVTAGEDRLRIDDEMPNARLWDKVAVAVQGYRTATIRPDQWAPVSAELAEAIPSGHKSAAIRGLYQTSFELERDLAFPDEEGFALGATVFTVRQTYGDYVIRHIFRSPTEAERREFRRKANDMRFTRSRRLVTKVFTNLEAYTELYDRLFQGIEGVEADPAATLLQLRDLVDPIWKRGAVDALMRGFEASLSD